MIAFCLAALLAQADAAHWPQWRGPTGDGVARGSAPQAWSDGEHVRWKLELPGRGVSTPIVYGERLFLTTAVPTDPDSSAPEPTEDGGRGAGSRPPEEQSFELHCLDRKSGALLWKSVARVATPHEGFHRSYGSFASASPITDGQRVYVNFGTQGVHAFDLEGKLVWSFDPGVKLEMRNSFGEGLAPVLAGGVLVQVADHEKGSFAFALDTATGKESWRVARDEPSTWATPLVTTLGGKQQVVTSGARKTRSYDVGSGKLLWEAAGAGLNAIPNVLQSGDEVLVMSGFREARILAIRPGDAASDQPVRSISTRGCGYTASPALHDGLYYTVTDSGLISCFDVATGKAHYLEERLPRGSQLKASPITAGGLLYVPTEAGEVHLVRLGPKYEVAATNTLAEQVFIASPVVVEGALYLRSLTHLFCIADA